MELQVDEDAKMPDYNKLFTQWVIRNTKKLKRNWTENLIAYLKEHDSVSLPVLPKTKTRPEINLNDYITRDDAIVLAEMALQSYMDDIKVQQEFRK